MADSMKRHGAGVEEVASGWHRVKGKAEGGWEGRASAAFQGFAAQQGGDGDALAGLFPRFGQACTVWADEIDTVKARMEQAKQVATEGQLMVFGDSIYPPKPFTGAPPGPVDPRVPGAEDRANQQSAQYEAAKALHAKQEAAFAEAQATVAQARGMEKVAHETLSRSMDAVTGALKDIGQAAEWGKAAAAPTSAVTAALAGAAMDMEAHAANATRAGFETALQQGPAAVRGCWASLTTAQRTDLMDRFPQMVGGADGVPVVDRDQANRSVLAAQRQGLVNKLDEERRRLREDPYHRRGISDSDSQYRIWQLEESLKGIDRLQEKLGPSAEQSDYYLLGVDGTVNSRGQAIIASGNPDNADNVLTSVPGTFSDLGDAMDYVDRNDRLAERAEQLNPGTKTAAITWSDYNSPSDLLNASDERFANEAKGDLARFQEGLRATHNGPPSHNTVLGHSYGSTVVGYAARDHGLSSDEIAFIGSPGVGVDRAEDLGVPPDHVWSGTSGHDIIDTWTPSLSPGDIGNGSDDHWYGMNPSDPHFGGQILETDPTAGHSDYWDREQSIDSISRVVAGNNREMPSNHG
ncbi:alpha/beta hydrolase [Saccharopolyspora erythraea]|nr:alpha/beta hydrolase [Saccharopolyspora erythraea]